MYELFKCYNNRKNINHLQKFINILILLTINHIEHLWLSEKFCIDFIKKVGILNKYVIIIIMVRWIRFKYIFAVDF